MYEKKENIILWQLSQAVIFKKSQHLKDKFEVIEAYKWEGIPGDTTCVSNFMLTHGNYDEKQLDEMVEMADIIVFQSMNSDHLNRPEIVQISY